MFKQWRWVPAILFTWLLSFSTTGADAEPIQINGITFSEASANFRLVRAFGSGSLEDPFVVIEEIWDRGDVILGISIDEANFGSRIQSFHAIGFALKKIVINRTGFDWYQFSLELERIIGVSSDYYDGLSFAQRAEANRPFRSSVFRTVDDITEPLDTIRFSDGTLRNGDSAEFTVSVTHTRQKPSFYLIQHTRRGVVDRDFGGKFAASSLSSGRFTPHAPPLSTSLTTPGPPTHGIYRQ